LFVAESVFRQAHIPMSTSTARTVCDDSETLDSAAHEDPTTSTTCIQHSTLMDKDVFKKYKILKVLGHGSMGTVAKVTIRPHRIGGSAVRSYNSGLFGTGIWKRKQQTHEIQLSASSEQPNHVYALKSIRLECVSGSFAKELHNEIDILKTLDHPNIVRLHEVYTCDREHQLYLVLDLCDGGDLYARAPYSQRHAASLMDQLVSAVQYMHHHGVVHRDRTYNGL
jgi:serine/threonine protein kinase